MLPDADILIAGAGPAGLSAAINGASEGLSVTLIDPGTIGGQARWSTAVENLAGFPSGITGKEYANRALRQARKFGAKLLTDRVDTFCTLKDRTIAVQLSSARMIECRHLILAIGLQPKPLDIPAPSFGVFTGANPDDIDRYTSQSVAIIGGGNSAGQAAVAFLRVGANVTLFARRDPHASMSRYLIDRLISTITIVESGVDAITRDPDGSLRIADKTFTAVFSFVGSAPSHTFPVQTIPDGYITTHHYCTSIANVYAIGDVRADSTKRIAFAVGEGSAVIARIHKDRGKA